MENIFENIVFLNEGLFDRNVDYISDNEFNKILKDFETIAEDLINLGSRAVSNLKHAELSGFTKTYLNLNINEAKTKFNSNKRMNPNKISAYISFAEKDYNTTGMDDDEMEAVSEAIANSTHSVLDELAQKYGFKQDKEYSDYYYSQRYKNLRIYMHSRGNHYDIGVCCYNDMYWKKKV